MTPAAVAWCVWLAAGLVGLSLELRDVEPDDPRYALWYVPGRGRAALAQAAVVAVVVAVVLLLGPIQLALVLARRSARS